jgi:tRNA-specific 2-thiouridylase
MVGGEPELRRSADSGKDQSYVLASLTPEQLSHAMFPLGDSWKTEVRAEAERRGLSVANKPDSHDICFIPDGDTKKFLENRLGQRPGELVDAETGAVLGQHTGVHGFTVGQRKGLGIEAPAPDGRPRYVLSLEPVSGSVKVGSAAGLGVTMIEADRAIWPSGRPLTEPTECVVQVRAHGGIVDAVADVDSDTMSVHLREPLRGVAPGQVVVLYRPDNENGDVVLGSAKISGTR